MRPLYASDLLNIWERSLGNTPVEQALIILDTAFPHVGWETLTKLTITQRDSALFHLRELSFGSRFNALAICAACGERLELVFDANELRAAGLFTSLDFSLPVEPFPSYHIQGYEIRFRLPTSLDVLKATALHENEQAHRYLLEACILSVRRRKRDVPLADLPPGMAQAIIAQIGQAAALANLTITAQCPACNHEWEVVFDIVSYFGREINAWAMRMMYEIHLLASTYGWREADILAMSAWRRQRYLELIGA